MRWSGVGPAMDIKMGFHKIAKYYYTGWQEPASEMQFIINKEKFDNLPQYLQIIITTAIKATSLDMYAEIYKLHSDAWESMQKDYPDIKIKHFPLKVLQDMKDINDQLIAKLEQRGGLTQEIIISQRKFLKKSRKWTKISEYYYLQNMFKLQ